MISPEYLAGVIDSDGSISITKRHMTRSKPNYAVMVQLGWVHKPETVAFMDKLVAQFGGTYKVIKPGKNSFSKRDHIKYCGFGETAEKIIEAVKPHLYLKNKQADNALKLREIVKTYANNGGGRSDSISQELEDLWSNNLSLNDKNGY